MQVGGSEVSNTHWTFVILLMVYMFGQVRQNFSLALIANKKKNDRPETQAWKKGIQTNLHIS